MCILRVFNFSWIFQQVSILFNSYLYAHKNHNDLQHPKSKTLLLMHISQVMVIIWVINSQAGSPNPPKNETNIHVFSIFKFLLNNKQRINSTSCTGKCRVIFLKMLTFLQHWYQSASEIKCRRSLKRQLWNRIRVQYPDFSGFWGVKRR